MVRVHVSGWDRTTPPTAVELVRRFPKAAVPGLEGVATGADAVVVGTMGAFGHLDLLLRPDADEAAVVSALEKLYNRAAWKGGTLRIQRAKPGILARLAAERELAERATTPERVANDQARSAPTDDLRIRKPRGNRALVKGKPSISTFDEKEDDVFPKVEEEEEEEDALTLTPAVAGLCHDMAACCSAGDAGPSLETMTPLASLVQQQLREHPAPPRPADAPHSLLGQFRRIHVDSNERGDTPLSAFVRSHVAAATPTATAVDAPDSLLGAWRRSS